MTTNKAVLNYYIQINKSIDVDRIINCSILQHLKSASVCLGHPSLIHELCVNQGVIFSPSEEVHHPKSAVIKQKISSYSSQLTFEPGENSSQPRPSPAKSKPLSLSDQIGQLKEKV